MVVLSWIVNYHSPKYYYGIKFLSKFAHSGLQLPIGVITFSKGRRDEMKLSIHPSVPSSIHPSYYTGFAFFQFL
jgi:hypothetical protein